MSCEFDRELAEFRVAQQRDAAITNIQASLKPSGRTKCCVCKDPIEPDRLAALLSAKTCIDCMNELEAL